MTKFFVIFALLSLISACRGLQGDSGSNGSNGKNAVASITVFSSTTCTSLGHGYYGKAVSNNYLVFDINNNANAAKCTGNNINMGSSYSTIWLDTDLLGVFVLPNSLRVIDFN